MIKLSYTPQRADMRAEYITNNDILTVKIGEVEETFDFTGLEKGIAEEIIADVLPINPIISAEKTHNIINIKVIRFYNSDEKELFENVTDNLEI